ncbi:hypothetical protein ELY21_04760 [Legionella sp. km535]|uniref:cyclin family putative virulence effector n=1 Tax=Legionella sp. km535 TaxID=2498107 RepID=UPI000F8E0C06|nr:cyclin family putative virulence effector [Legionella sp. km535]RUR19203.1 hypothetical protein ELY21_04760 [Legionella sp. km535]
MKLFFAQHKTTQSVQAPEYPKISDVSASFLLKTITSVLTKAVTTNSSKSHAKDVFTGACVPQISIEKYLLRFYEFLDDDPTIYVSSLIYISMYLELTPDSSLNELNVHRLIACSILLAYKQLMDFRHKNKRFAAIAGVNLSELNSLEIKFLTIFDFATHVSPEHFEECYHCLLDSVTLEYEINSSPG